ncbi:MAG: protease HtpX [Bacteriovorax sp.]|nr:protease HtpX [Bacteriovorax sp.]
MKRVVLFILVNILVVAGLSILINVLGIGQSLTSAGMSYGPLLLFCFFWGMLGSLISLMLSKVMARWMMGVQIVTLASPHRSLVETVHRLSRRAGLLEMPEVGIYQSEVLNAFATGPSRNNSLVAVSSGLLATMSDEEVEGVLAHEVSHIANGDMVTMALVQGVVNAFVMFFSRIVAFAITQSMRSSDERNQRPNPMIQMMLVFVLDLVFGILAAPIVAWFSRDREFRADHGAADLAGKEKMIAALNALMRAYPQLESSEDKGSASFRSMQITSKDAMMRLFSSHPPLRERIAQLQGHKTF